MELNGDLNGFLTPPKGFATRAIHVGQEPEQWKSMAVIPPISLSTTFKQFAPGKYAVSKFNVNLNNLKIYLIHMNNLINIKID